MLILFDALQLWSVCSSLLLLGEAAPMNDALRRPRGPSRTAALVWEHFKHEKTGNSVEEARTRMAFVKRDRKAFRDLKGW